MRRDLIYSIHDLSVEGKDLDIPLESEWLRAALEGSDLSPIEGERGRFSGRLSMSGKDVIVRGHVKVKVETPCARCLNPATIQVNSELTLLLSPGPSQAQLARIEKAKNAEPESVKPTRARKAREAKTAEAELKQKPKTTRENSKDGYVFSSGEADSDCYEGEEVVLDGFIREVILLEMPIFPLCSEQCPGIAAIPVEPTNM